MRAWSLVSVLAVATGCMVKLPRPGQIGIKVKTTTRVEVHVPPPPTPVVAIVDAPVVEFFGIPLDNAQDVVFVLDCSGSMANAAQGRLAQLHTAAPAPRPPDAPPPPP